MSDIAVTWGLGFVIIAYYVFTNDLLQKPQGAMNVKIIKYFRMKDAAVLLHLLNGFLLVGFTWFLVILSDGSSFADIVEGFAIVATWLTIGLFIGYVTVYVLFRTNEEMEGLQRKIRGKL